MKKNFGRIPAMKKATLSSVLFFFRNSFCSTVSLKHVPGNLKISIAGVKLSANHHAIRKELTFNTLLH